MTAICPTDLGEAVHALLTDLTFELRALTDLLSQMTRPDDQASAERARRTCAALDDLARHLMPLMTLDDELAFCCVLEWHWHHERPRFCARLEAGDLARATLALDDYDAHWRRLAPLVRRELARYAAAARRLSVRGAR